MDVVHLIVLAAVQGVTEFLPISSSGHLVLVPLFMDVPDQGLMLDVAVHVGTLFAVIVYFSRDVLSMFTSLEPVAWPKRLTGAFGGPVNRRHNPR